MISGYQNAVGTGPAGSEIHYDEYGRVKVQLAWDRDGEYNEHSSCGLRVASGWARKQYGSVLIPRVGMDVLVGFVNGDADMPLVETVMQGEGGVFHGGYRPPWMTGHNKSGPGQAFRFFCAPACVSDISTA